MGQELEYKYRVADARQMEALAAWLARELGARWDLVEMESTYYDTPDRDLAARRWALRLRRENHRTVATIKTPGPGRVRGEWEVEAGDLAQALPALAALGAPAALPELAQKGLAPRCTARFTRRRSLIAPPGFQAEAALDQGELAAGGRSRPFRELEIEWKGGDSQSMARWCETFARRWALPQEPESKLARALALAGE